MAEATSEEQQSSEIDEPAKDRWFDGFARRVQRWRAATPSHGGLFRLLLAAALGVSAAYGALLFRYLIAAFKALAFPFGMALSTLRNQPWYRMMLPPAIGGAVVGPLVHFFAREAKGHGVPEVKDACTNRGGRIRPRVAVVKILASGVCIGSGGSVGREGPIVQIGAALGSGVGQLFGLRGADLIDFVAAGAAAGIAATFNAPIAGVVFAVEVIMGRSSPRHFSPLVVASVMATVITHAHIGATPAFVVPAYTLVSGWELLLYVVLGGLAGLIGVGFTRGLYWIEDLWKEVPGPPYAHGIIGGLLVGAFAIYLPEILGVGYELIEGVLGAAAEPWRLVDTGVQLHLLLLIGMKILATGTTIGSGGSGGVFAPALFLGASLGGAFGGVAHRWLPAGTVAQPAAYGLVGMGAVVGATTHAPLTAILIVFELCDHHSIILPLMLATVVSTIVAMALCRESIYTMKLVRRGARTGGAAADPAARVRATRVRELMQPLAAWVRPSARIDAIVERAHSHEAHEVYVVDDKRVVIGAVSMDDVAAHIQDSPAQRRKLRADSLMHAVAAVSLEMSLDVTMDALAERGQEQLPVCDERGRLVGVINRGDLLAYYSRELLRQETVLDMVRDAHSDPVREEIRLGPDEVQAAITIGKGLAGKNLRELGLRRRFGVSVYAVRDAKGHAKMPTATEPLIEGEVLVVVGPEAEVGHVRALSTGLLRLGTAETSLPEDLPK